MLLIAIPKSASTSLMRTLGELHSLDASQDFTFHNNPAPSGSRYLHSIHSDIRKLNKNDVLGFSGNNKIYKQHIYPSSSNMELLHRDRKVVLLREPREVCLAYRRGALKKVHALLPGFSVELGEDEWIERAMETGLYADLEFFFNQWSMSDASGNTLIVDYNRLMKSPKSVIRDIESFWELDLTEDNVVLARERYTRRSWISSTILKTRKLMKRIAVKALEALGIKDSVRRLIRKN